MVAVGFNSPHSGLVKVVTDFVDFLSSIDFKYTLCYFYPKLKEGF
jgi:hypothetical protein